jgi:hypothetical protein
MVHETIRALVRAERRNATLASFARWAGVTV